MRAPRTYEFIVSAPVPATLDWLHGRALKSGEGVSGDLGKSRFAVRWRVAGEAAPVTLDFAVHALRAGVSRVTVTPRGQLENTRAVVQDFAGALGERMTGLEMRSQGFFDPPRTERDDLLIGAWAGLFAVLLVIAAAIRSGHDDGEQMTTHEALWFIAPIVIAPIAAGLAGGLVVRRGSRWYEPLVGGLAVGCVVSWPVFNVWFVSMEDPGECGGSCEHALGFGAALLAVPEALLLVGGILAGRALASAVSLVRRAVVRPG